MKTSKLNTISLEMERLQKNAKWQLDYNYSLLETKSYISILSLNTRSMQIHIDDLLNDYDLMQFDILCLQEIHLTQPTLLKRLEEFNCIPYYSKHGLLVCTKKHIKILKHIHFEEKNIEATLANMIIHGMDIIVLNVYVAPYATLNDALHLLSKSLCNTHSNQTIAIVDDFNINMLENNNKTNRLRSYMYNYNHHFLLDTNNNQ